LKKSSCRSCDCTVIRSDELHDWTSNPLNSVAESPDFHTENPRKVGSFPHSRKWRFYNYLCGPYPQSGPALQLAFPACPRYSHGRRSEVRTRLPPLWPPTDLEYADQQNYAAFGGRYVRHARHSRRSTRSQASGRRSGIRGRGDSARPRVHGAPDQTWSRTTCRLSGASSFRAAIFVYGPGSDPPERLTLQPPVATSAQVPVRTGPEACTQVSTGRI